MIKDVITVILKKENLKNVEILIFGGLFKFLLENPRGRNLKNRKNELKKNSIENRPPPPQRQ